MFTTCCFIAHSGELNRKTKLLILRLGLLVENRRLTKEARSGCDLQVAAKKLEGGIALC